MKLSSFVYPGCIIVCNTGVKADCGNYPEIARIFKDRTVCWKSKRISDQMREYVDSIARSPFIAISYTQKENFFTNTYYIVNDNTFGYAENDSDKRENRFFHLTVMAVDVLKGGDPTLIDRTMLADKNTVKVALPDDAERFKVRI